MNRILKTLSKQNPLSNKLSFPLQTRGFQPRKSLEKVFNNRAETDFLNQVYHFVQQAGIYTKIDKQKIDVYKKNDSVLKTNFSIVKDNGELEMFSAYRVQHKTHLLPTKGGTRIGKNVNLLQQEALSILMGFKCALLNIPYGGAHGGIRCDLNNYSEREQESIIRNYTLKLVQNRSFGANIDVPGPDQGTSSKQMNLMLDQYHSFFGHNDVNVYACVTGKSKSRFGVEGYDDANGIAVQQVLEQILHNQSILKQYQISEGIKDKTFICQGFGRRGASIAKKLLSQGAIMIGVMSSTAGIYNKKGIDPDQLLEFINQTTINKLQGYPHAQYLKNEELMQKRCDIYIPAAEERCVNESNVKLLNCSIVLEAANGPLTPQSDRYLYEKNVLVLPDILVNSGGVISSYFEWLKNLEHRIPGNMTKRWEKQSNLKLIQIMSEQHNINLEQTLDESELEYLTRGPSEKDLLFSAVKEIVGEAIKKTVNISLEKQISLREAAYVSALNNLDQYHEEGNIIPSQL